MGGDFIVRGFSQHEDGRERPKMFRFTIPGHAIGKPTQSRGDRWRQRECVMRYRAFCDLARLSAREVGTLPPPDSITEFRCTCFFLPPESESAKKRGSLIGQRHRVKPDSDNIAKAVFDSLYHRDQAIADLVVRKRYDWTPRVEIEIEYE